jgi:hypothetical protein
VCLSALRGRAGKRTARAVRRSSKVRERFGPPGAPRRAPRALPKFVLTCPLVAERVRNYDGSWTEWGNLVRAPIDR